MTECTGRRYWTQRIRDASNRYVARACKQGPKFSGIQSDEYHAWVKTRVDYFNHELAMLNGNGHYSRTGYINGVARDLRK